MENRRNRRNTGQTSRWHGPLGGLLLVIAMLLVPLPGALAQNRVPRRPTASPVSHEPGDFLRVYVLTFGPGSHLFARFGHNAIWIHDARARTDRVYNFGTIPPSKNLVRDFMKGRMKYSVSVSTLSRTLRHYRANDQSIDALELDLEPAQRAWLQAKVRHHALPENRWYLYDYYLDNCSTKIRDLVDEVLGGDLRRVADVPATLTRREHSIRLTDGDPISYAINAGLGRRADGPQTRWDEMFLPSVLTDTLATATVLRDRVRQPLVKRRFSFHESTRPPVPAMPPDRRLKTGLMGLLWGGAFAGLGLGARRAPRGVTRQLLVGLLWTLAAVVSLVGGLLGSILLYFWVLTDHVIAHQNENILQFSPLALGIVGLACTAPWSPRAADRASVVALVVALLAWVGLLLKVLPPFYQANGEFIALALPLWTGLAVGLHLIGAADAFPWPALERLALRSGLARFAVLTWRGTAKSAGQKL